jgi:ABC-2 type transport system ATP-binding protein
LIAAEGGKAMAQEPSDEQAAALSVTGLEAPRIGEIAAANRIVLHELTPQLASLEEAFMELTAGSVEYGGGETAAAGSPAAASTTTPGGSQ